MKIIFICNEYPPSSHGGIGIFVKSLAEELSRLKHEVAVIGYDYSITEDSKRLENCVLVQRLINPFQKIKGIRIGRFGLSLKPIKERKYLSKQLDLLISEIKPDIIESFDWSGPLWQKPNGKFVVRLHGANTAHQHFENKKKSRLMYFLEKRNLVQSDALIAVSEHIGKLTLDAFGLKKHYNVIYNYVDASLFSSNNKKDQVRKNMLYLGRIHSRKGIESLLEVVKVVFRDNKHEDLHLIGPGDPSFISKLKSQLEEYSDRVKFLSPVKHEDLPSIISNYKIMLMPSKAEAFGLVVIEGMSCETPVLMSGHASAYELIEDKRGGYLVNFNKTIETASLLKELLSSPELLSEQGKMSRDRILKKFEKKTLISENISFYESLINQDEMKNNDN